MRKFKNLGHILPDKKAATAIEYGLLIGLIAIVLVPVLTTLGSSGHGGIRDIFRCSALYLSADNKTTNYCESYLGAKTDKPRTG